MSRLLIPEWGFREYRPADWKAVRALFIAVNKELAPPNLKQAFDDYVATALETEIDRIPDYYAAKNGSFWIAEDAGGELVGMYGLEQAGVKIVELRRMYVAPRVRRQGLARCMLHHAEEQASRSENQCLILSTSSLQGPAIAFYRSAGFHLTREECSHAASHKSIGAGVKRLHFAKQL
ncbi:MAG: GNAT family N-acetyltransferase [Rhizobiaceae bacterium]